MEWIDIAVELPRIGQEILIQWRCPTGNNYNYVDKAVLDSKVETAKGMEYVWRFVSMGWPNEKRYLNNDGDTKKSFVFKWMPIPEPQK